MSEVTRKTCRSCGMIYPIEYFTISAKSKGGRSNRCKSCHAQRMRDIRDGILNLEEVRRDYDIVRIPTDQGTTVIRFGDHHKPAHTEKRITELRYASPLSDVLDTF